MAAANTDKFKKAKRRFSTTIGVGGFTAGATTLPLTSTSGLDTDTAITLVIEPGSINEEVITGVVNGSNVINCVRGKEGTSDATHVAGSAVSMYFTETHWDDLINGILVSHNQDGTLANNAITTASITDGVVTNAKLNSDLQQGWINLNDSPDTITYNGNRSYDLVYNSTDLTSTLSPGMRMKLTRTVAAPTQCTSLNGSTQYFSRASASVTGMTFTTTFTVTGKIKLTSYPTNNAYIFSRGDSTAANGWGLAIDSSGRAMVIIINGGASNTRIVSTIQSIPLNKWIDIAMTYSSGTVTAYIDGVSVSVNAASTGGTAPTACVNTGDIGIGRFGASTSANYFPGKISQTAVFSSVLSQSTIQSYISQKLSGTETNLVSAYSLSNSTSDLNTTNANNLTANNSATTTDTDSPFADAVTAGLQEYAIVTKVAYSTNTTVTVQVPEGCAIPTTGGVSASYYSMQRSPFGMPVSTDRWMLTAINKAGGNSSVATATWSNITSLNITVPVGSWNLAYKVSVYIASATGGVGMMTTLSTANNSESNGKFTVRTENPGGTQAVTAAHSLYPEPVTASSATPYYLNSLQSSGSTIAIYNFGDRNGGTVINAYLGLL